MIDQGADINAVDKDGRTPLHDAIRVGVENVACLLIDRGADINATDKDGRTPLHDAALNESEMLLRLFTGQKPLVSNNPYDTIVDRTFQIPNTAVFLWELPEIVEKPNDVESTVYSLRNILTLTREENSVEMISCQDYVQRRFGAWGVHILSDIAFAMNAKGHCHSR
ncbi:ankyrin repeat-containing domain protein [Aspergillus alliaceus]|uniref:Ankyrin repeat-containing domain protein n=1 Tax=Petromyces alliaceus TaxID=209559 RepID=A0A5N7BX05_PETAA|nr:ankyrin repeat-containing domain protein [Aspergillus alliaceus]